MNRYKIMVVLLTAGMFDAVFAHGLFLLADLNNATKRTNITTSLIPQKEGAWCRIGENKEASCITVGLFDTDSDVKRCEHGARSAECLQRAA